MSAVRKKRKKRVRTRAIRVVSSGCKHRNIIPGGFGDTTECMDCGSIAVTFWVRP